MTPIEWLASAVFRSSWQAAALGMLILLLQRAMARRISARARYALWALVVLRLALPVDVPSPLSFRNYLRPDRPATIPAVTRQSPAVAPPEALRAAPPSRQPLTATPPAVRPPIHWGRWLAAAWAVGCITGLGFVLLVSLRLSRQVNRHRPVHDPRVLRLLMACATELGVRRPPAVVSGPDAPGPALVGFVRPTLLLPQPVLAFDDAALRLILLHELAHQKRGDVLSNWLLALLQCAHWFNPAVHLLLARVRADRELACDERVLSLTGSVADRPAYGRTIVRLAESLSTHDAYLPAPAVGILEGGHQLKRRIAMIAEHRPVRRAWSLLALLVATGVAAVACTEAVGKDKPAAETAKAAPPAQAPVPAPQPGDATDNTTIPADARSITLQGPARVETPRGTVTLFAQQDARLAKRLPEVKFDATPMSDALDFVKDVAGLNLFVDRQALGAMNIDLNSPVTLDLKNITVEQAFRLIGRAAAPAGLDLGATAEGDVIVFGILPGNAPGAPVAPGAPGAAPADPAFGGPMAPGGARAPQFGLTVGRPASPAAAEHAVTRVYNVDPICGQNQEKLDTLFRVLQSSLKLEKSSALLSMNTLNGKLVVTATPDLHDQLADLINILKEQAPATAATTQPVPRAPSPAQF